MRQTLYITHKKHKKLFIELKQLQDSYRSFAQGELADAVSHGDIRENAEYDSALLRQNHAAAIIADLQNALSSSVCFIDDLNIATDCVSIGTKVTVQEIGGGKIETYDILGPYESDIDKGIISYLAPFSKLMIRKKVDDIVELKQSKKSYRIIKIEKIDFTTTTEDNK